GSVEALPDVGAPSIADIKLDRLTVDPDESAVDEQIQQLASQSKRWEDAAKKHAAATGDLVVMCFEDQLVGAKPGESREVKVNFPDDYPVENLKNKDAVFAVTVKAVKTSGEN